VTEDARAFSLTACRHLDDSSANISSCNETPK